MSLKFFRGVGQPPPFVSDITFGPKGGLLRIRYAESETHDLPYSTSNDLANKIEILVRHKIPFAFGHNGAGPAETLEIMIELNKLIVIPPYIKISWFESGEWEMREIKEGQTEWLPAAGQDEISTRRYLPAWIV